MQSESDFHLISQEMTHTHTGRKYEEVGKEEKSFSFNLQFIR